MSSVSKRLTYLVLLLSPLIALAGEPPLRVCADPSNLPFSNIREQGFENILARMVARDIHREIQFIWWPQRARFVEKRLKAQTCDLVMGIPSSFELLLPTTPYYRSGYVFVSLRDRQIGAKSITDAALKRYRVGAQIIGDDDGAMVPPAAEMARRGMLRNIVGYSLYGHPLAENPSAEIISAVENREVDMAIAWGPLAGYFAQKSAVPLAISAICPLADHNAQPFQFDISMGVKPGDYQLLEQLNNFIVTHRKEIRSLLMSYGVPMLEKGKSMPVCR